MVNHRGVSHNSKRPCMAEKPSQLPPKPHIADNIDANMLVKMPTYLKKRDMHRHCAAINALLLAILKYIMFGKYRRCSQKHKPTVVGT